MFRSDPQVRFTRDDARALDRLLDDFEHQVRVEWMRDE
jgi:hypothetical protein